jgi:hypothetical protein
MRQSTSRGVAPRIILSAALTTVTLAIAGCILPVSYSEPGSPEVVGQLRRSDGTPAAGARIVVTADGDDAACGRPLGVGTTDADGVFRLAPTRVQRRGIWLVPAIEHFANTYWICVGVVDSLLHMAYRGATSLRGNPASATDSLTCLEWAWQDSARVTCAGPMEKRSIQTGGRWTDGTRSGVYRLIVVEPQWRVRDAGVFVQWVEQPAAGSPEIVRQIVAIPLIAKPLGIDEARLWPDRAGRAACVSVESTGEATSFWTWDTPRERAAFVLGAPGETRPVAHCADATEGTLSIH